MPAEVLQVQPHKLYKFCIENIQLPKRVCKQHDKMASRHLHERQLNPEQPLVQFVNKAKCKLINAEFILGK